MKIAEYKQVGTKLEKKLVYHEEEYSKRPVHIEAVYDDEGNLISEAYDYEEEYVSKEAYEEEVDVEVPVMGMVYREETTQENNERLRQEKEYENSKEYKQKEIENLKAKLDETDYKIIKCYEAKLNNLEISNEINDVIEERKKWREMINQLEADLEAKESE